MSSAGRTTYGETLCCLNCPKRSSHSQTARFFGTSIGAAGRTVVKWCSTPPSPGYQEILTDPSYSRQIVT